MSIAIVCFPGSDVINFEINLTFLIKSFFYMIKKPRLKFKHFENEKNFKDEIKRRNKNHFSSFLQGFQLPKIVSDLRMHL